jgi:hypothetical protein
LADIAGSSVKQHFGALHRQREIGEITVDHLNGHCLADTIAMSASDHFDESLREWPG